MKALFASAALLAVAILPSGCLDEDVTPISEGYYVGPEDSTFALVAFKRDGKKLRAYEVFQYECEDRQVHGFGRAGATNPPGEEVPTSAVEGCFSGDFVRESDEVVEVVITDNEYASLLPGPSSSFRPGEVIERYDMTRTTFEEWQALFVALDFHKQAENRLLLRGSQEQFCRDLFEQSCDDLLPPIELPR